MRETGSFPASLGVRSRPYEKKKRCSKKTQMNVSERRHTHCARSAPVTAMLHEVATVDARDLERRMLGNAPVSGRGTCGFLLGIIWERSDVPE